MQFDMSKTPGFTKSLSKGNGAGHWCSIGPTNVRSRLTRHHVHTKSSRPYVHPRMVHSGRHVRNSLLDGSRPGAGVTTVEKPLAQGQTSATPLGAHTGEKFIVLVRHGHSSWNDEGRIQGNTDESELTSQGAVQAVMVREALVHMHFDRCYASPHRRARQTAEIICNRPSVPLTYLDSLREADLGWFQGKTNRDIAQQYPELYRVWRERPEDFCLDGRYPVRDAFDQARRAWAEITSSPGQCHLVITHKSIMRALLCTAMDMPPDKFRAMDVSNGAICMFRVKSSGEKMLHGLNLVSHLQFPGVYYTAPKKNINEVLTAQPSGSLGDAGVVVGS